MSPYTQKSDSQKGVGCIPSRDRRKSLVGNGIMMENQQRLNWECFPRNTGMKERSQVASGNGLP